MHPSQVHANLGRPGEGEGEGADRRHRRDRATSPSSENQKRTAETRRKTEIGKQSRTSPLIHGKPGQDYTDDTDRRGYSGVGLWKPFRILIEG
jgi:hypothetical protein